MNLAIPSLSSTSPSSCLLSNNTQTPDEIWKIIFSCLDFQDQTRISLVCRRWRNLVKDSSLAFGKALAVMRMALSIPTKETWMTSTASGDISFHGANSQFILVSRDEPPISMDVIHKISRKILQIELTDALSNEEKKCDSLKVQSLQDATWIAEDSFATVTCQGTVAWWKVTANMVACVAHLQIFDEDERQQRQSVQDPSESFWILKIAYLSQFHHLYIKGGPSSSKDFIEILTVDSQKHDSTLTKVCTILENSNDFFSFDIHDSQRLLFNTVFQNLQCYQPNLTDCPPAACLFDIPLRRAVDSSVSQIIPIGANDSWVVVATYHDSYNPRSTNDCEVTHFQVFKTQTGEEVFEFVLPFDLAGQMSKNRRSSTCNWLCGDFIVVWIDEKLVVWHILSKQHLTTFDLQPLFAHDPFYNYSLSNNPLHVEMKDQSLQVFLNHPDQNDLHTIQFKLEQTDNSKVFVHPKQNSFPGMEKYQIKHSSSKWMFIASKISQLFQVFLRLIVKIKSCLAF